MFAATATGTYNYLPFKQQQQVAIYSVYPAFAFTFRKPKFDTKLGKMFAVETIQCEETSPIDEAIACSLIKILKTVRHRYLPYRYRDVGHYQKKQYNVPTRKLYKIILSQK